MSWGGGRREGGAGDSAPRAGGRVDVVEFCRTVLLGTGTGFRPSRFQVGDRGLVFTPLLDQSLLMFSPPIHDDSPPRPCHSPSSPPYTVHVSCPQSCSTGALLRSRVRQNFFLLRHRAHSVVRHATGGLEPWPARPPDHAWSCRACTFYSARGYSPSPWTGHRSGRAR